MLAQNLVSNDIKNDFVAICSRFHKHSTVLYEELLDLTNETSPQQRCLNVLMTEPYKPLNGLSPGIMNDIFAVSKHQYNTRHYNLLVTDRPKTDRNGRNSANLNSFKLKIKQWHCLECSCTLCKTYLPNLGYL